MKEQILNVGTYNGKTYQLIGIYKEVPIKQKHNYYNSGCSSCPSQCGTELVLERFVVRMIANGVETDYSLEQLAGVQTDLQNEILTKLISVIKDNGDGTFGLKIDGSSIVIPPITVDNTAIIAKLEEIKQALNTNHDELLDWYNVNLIPKIDTIISNQGTGGSTDLTPIITKINELITNDNTLSANEIAALDALKLSIQTNFTDLKAADLVNTNNTISAINTLSTDLIAKIDISNGLLTDIKNVITTELAEANDNLVILHNDMTTLNANTDQIESLLTDIKTNTTPQNIVKTQAHFNWFEPTALSISFTEIIEQKLPQTIGKKITQVTVIGRDEVSKVIETTNNTVADEFNLQTWGNYVIGDQVNGVILDNLFTGVANYMFVVEWVV